MKTCTKCKKLKPFEDFYKCARRKDGYASQCKQCSNALTKASRSKRTDHYRKLRNNFKRKRRDLFASCKREVGCMLCSENEPACLDLHHINPDEKDFNLSAVSGYTWEKVFKEIEKCVLVCKNCHTKIHEGLIVCPSQPTTLTKLIKTKIKEMPS